ncbi:hypothetical protein CRM22_006817 [Opisthorchis felineus]|uniref:ESF1 RRM domain-containing protein n=1 Tax=Opisthorchis felineus TaxID=147828 RepID=A0A4S2LJ26_OPIFE|nr:hypothetical protein CRM22_006817 [Opisthorchis felineus]
MKDSDLDRVARDPKFAPGKRKPVKRSRTARQLFEDIEQEASFKDKRGRPWLRNPRAYVRAKFAHKASHNEESLPEEEPQLDVSRGKSSSLEASLQDSSTTSSSDEDADPFEVIADLRDADWTELTKDAPQATQIGKRLALLHFDWDNAKAENIYMVLQSFLPPRGHIECVTIYPSEFGIKRMEEETTKGPPELVNPSSDDEAENQDTDSQRNETEISDAAELDDKAGWRRASTQLKRRIRKYQLARLKYFYAIIEFDSAETTEAVYEACDGLEYESSGARFDLRFVNDEETFSVPPEHAALVSECREINKAKYNPRPFETSALHSTRIGIGWDKTPDERTCWLRDQFLPEADPKLTLTEHKDELERYLALSSSGASTAASSDVDEEPPAPTVPRIHRHRPKRIPPEELRAALLGAIGTKTMNTSDEDNILEEDVPMEDEEEEVFDLGTEKNQTKEAGESSDEEYYLGPVEKRASKNTVRSGKNRKVPKRILPEAIDDIVDQSDSDGFEDEQATDRKEEITKKKKRKEKQRNKMLVKKRQVQERLKKQATLWTTSESTETNFVDDNRFDAFLTDPSFQVSQTHPDYKEASDFLRYMRHRRTLVNCSAHRTLSLGAEL